MAHVDKGECAGYYPKECGEEIISEWYLGKPQTDVLNVIWSIGYQAYEQDSLEAVLFDPFVDSGEFPLDESGKSLSADVAGYEEFQNSAQRGEKKFAMN